MYFVFSAFVNRPTSLQVSNRVFVVFVFTVVIFPPSVDQGLMCPIKFHYLSILLTVLMAHPKAKLKINCSKAFPYFRVL